MAQWKCTRTTLLPGHEVRVRLELIHPREWVPQIQVETPLHVQSPHLEYLGSQEQQRGDQIISRHEYFLRHQSSSNMIHLPTQKLTWTTPYSDNVLVTELAGMDFTVIQRNEHFKPSLELVTFPATEQTNDDLWIWWLGIGMMGSLLLVWHQKHLRKPSITPIKNPFEHLDQLSSTEVEHVLELAEKFPMSQTERNTWNEARYGQFSKNEHGRRQSALIQIIREHKVTHPEWFKAHQVGDPLC